MEPASDSRPGSAAKVGFFSFHCYTCRHNCRHVIIVVVVVVVVVVVIIVINVQDLVETNSGDPNNAGAPGMMENNSRVSSAGSADTGAMEEEEEEEEEEELDDGLDDVDDIEDGLLVEEEKGTQNSLPMEARARSPKP